jgi:hypothetical protein
MHRSITTISRSTQLWTVNPKKAKKRRMNQVLAPFLLRHYSRKIRRLQFDSLSIIVMPRAQAVWDTVIKNYIQCNTNTATNYCISEPR